MINAGGQGSDGGYVLGISAAYENQALDGILLNKLLNFLSIS